MRAHLATAWPFQFEPPTQPMLDSLAEQYELITGQHARSQAQRNLLAGCYRVHGPDAIRFIADGFAASRTAINLLGNVRCAAPRDLAEGTPRGDRESSVEHDEASFASWSGDYVVEADHVGFPCPIDLCLESLIYCTLHHPAFDGRSRRRYDRCASNPDAASYFADVTRPSAHSSPAWTWPA